MPLWRIVVHALDRTGPPVLARTFIRWLRATHPHDEVEVIAIRGGPLIDDFVRLAPVTVLVEPSAALDVNEANAWPHMGLEQLRVPDATLLVSVAAGQVLPSMRHTGPILTWAVEQGPDLHWVDEQTGLRERTTTWLAGSESVRAELSAKLDRDDVWVQPEFVDPPGAIDPELVVRCREVLAKDPEELLVVGAGIATHRKAPDLFLEAAHRYADSSGPPARFVWIGGEGDDLYWPVRDEAARLGATSFRTFESVPEVTPWLAAADVFLHPARIDAFPLVCLHAALAHTPVVAFAGVGGVTEMFGETFLGAPYPDLPQLLREIERLADPSIRRRAAAAQFTRAAHDWTSAVSGPLLRSALLASTQTSEADQDHQGD